MAPIAAEAWDWILLETAERNGYTSAALGCPFICADGFMGTDDLLVELPEGYLLKEAYVAQAIAAADVLITLTHFKGHASGVFGGAIKNVGIGAQSKRGKLNVHMSGHPTVWSDRQQQISSGELQRPRGVKGVGRCLRKFVPTD